MEKKILFITIASIFVLALVVGAFSFKSANAVRSANIMDRRSGGFMCRFSPDFCTCNPSRVCVDSNTVRTTTQQCVVNTYDCAAGQLCQAGNCVQVNDICTDSDNGLNPNVTGIVTINYTNGTNIAGSDSCIGSNQVLEYYCSGNNLGTVIINCPMGKVCSNGACIEPIFSDLRISNVWLVNYPNNKSVFVNVTNIGNANAPASTLAVNSSTIGFTRSVPSILVGGSRIVSVGFSPSTTGLVFVMADYPMAIMESNENNNIYFNSTFFG